MEAIGIITYPFLSGLYYLAKSYMAANPGYDYFLFPKQSLIKQGNAWVWVTKSLNPEFVQLNNWIADLIDCCKKNNIKKIISFETFMLNNKWVGLLKKAGIKVIDIPMIEWVIPTTLELYELFNEIYCLNNYTYSYFSHFKTASLRSWNYCPDINFKSTAKDNYLHIGSTTTSLQKGTAAFIKAAAELKHLNFTLIGEIDNLKLTDNIKYMGKNLNRGIILDTYKEAECIILPSSREGLCIPLYEAKSAGIKTMVTNIEPICGLADFLLNPLTYKKDQNSFVQYAIVDSAEIINKILEYEEYKKRK